jgi:E-phenylitaconyl-CoA hydratase
MSIRTERKGAVLIVTIDRPEARNALSLEMGEALCEVWQTFRSDPELRVAVLTGAGDKAFCAGADLKEVGAYYASMTPFERRERSETAPGVGGITRNLPVWKPIIAAINGYCLAGGLEIALACDMRIAAESATFGLTEVKWGIIPGAGGTQRLPRLIGPSRALKMILTAERIDAIEACGIGLVEEVVAGGKALERALELAGAICANAPLAVRAAKEAVWRGLDLSLDEGLRLEQFLAEPLRTSEDSAEGRAAFIEKRAPNFKGR